MTRIDLARKLRPIIERAAQTALDDTTALGAVLLFPRWKAGVTYPAESRVNHDGTLYRCLQEHTAQESWNPVDAPSLWAKVLIPDPDVIPEWEQPGSTNAYMKGDKVTFNGVVYQSLIDGNVWSPEAYHEGWELLIDG